MKTLSLEKMENVEGGMPIPDCEEMFFEIFNPYLDAAGQAYWIDMYFSYDCHLE